MGAPPEKLIKDAVPPKIRRKISPGGFKALSIIALIALILQSGMLLIALFEPPLPYSIPAPGPESLDSEEFVRTLEAVTGGSLFRNNRLEVLTNGEAFYEAELAAIRAAQRFVHVECYIFQKGRVTDRLLEAVTERARAGVEVRLLLDAIGSAGFPDSRFAELRGAGGRAAWYHPIKWYTWPRINNRTHREIVIVDGETGFVGGAGFADHWLISEPDHPRWRDTMVRVEGDAATGLQAAFSENWLEATGDMLVRPEYYPFRAGPEKTPAIVVRSSPTTGRSTQARVLFQALLAKANRRIDITSPYFLPDKSLTGEIGRAIRERGVEVRILVPGKKSDHAMTRSSSRGLYGDLLAAGARIYEYEPSMIHAKTMIVDGLWAVVGSTNMDSRSFGLNDEVNLAVLNRAFAERLDRDFEADLRRAHAVSLEEWRKRPPKEHVQEWIGWLLARQQ